MGRDFQSHRRCRICLLRKSGRFGSGARRDCASDYWHETSYNLLGRPTGANDSRTLVREWLYNRRSELASAQVGANAYDTIGNRLTTTDGDETSNWMDKEAVIQENVLRKLCPELGWTPLRAQYSKPNDSMLNPWQPIWEWLW